MGESRTELLAWLNDLLQLNYTKIEQCGTGAAYCQIIDSIYGKMKFFCALRGFIVYVTLTMVFARIVGWCVALHGCGGQLPCFDIQVTYQWFESR